MKYFATFSEPVVIDEKYIRARFGDEVYACDKFGFIHIPTASQYKILVVDETCSLDKETIVTSLTNVTGQQPTLIRPLYNIYVAGAFADAATMKGRMTDVKKYGHTITHDWTSEDPAVLAAMRNEDGTYKQEYLKQCGINDMNGVKNAEIVIACLDLPTYEYRGTWTEVGAAIALNKRIMVYMPNKAENKNAQNVFLYMDNITIYDDWNALLEKLNQL